LKLLVTGGAGFIGSNFIRYMLNKYDIYEIINLDCLSYAGNLNNLKDIELNTNYNFVKGDITDKDLIDRIVSKGINCIINFAAESHVDRSIREPDIFIKTNIVGTHILLESARKYNIKKFIHISTDEVYGTLGNVGRFNEDTPIAPNNPYSASKASSDLLARAYFKTYGLPITITRCSNNFGPFQFPEKFIPLVITNAIEGKKIPIYGDGKQIRDWIYVEDHCRAIDLILHKGKSGEVYNIGSYNEITNINLVKTILKELNKSQELIEFVEDRPGHDRRYAMNSIKLRELGWKPKYNFNSGLTTTIDWYVSNTAWWKYLKTKYNTVKDLT